MAELLCVCLRGAQYLAWPHRLSRLSFFPLSFRAERGRVMEVIAVIYFWGSQYGSLQTIGRTRSKTRPRSGQNQVRSCLLTHIFPRVLRENIFSMHRLGVQNFSQLDFSLKHFNKQDIFFFSPQVRIVQVTSVCDSSRSRGTVFKRRRRLRLERGGIFFMFQIRLSKPVVRARVRDSPCGEKSDPGTEPPFPGPSPGHSRESPPSSFFGLVCVSDFHICA